ncbi:helix-turn-helix domain-containing protein [Streptomyces maremycinicus]|uniref:helix-turn-helix domain-containing protein n=1 Tax=Streptomyces maremycinicus TaxID=1679753 RepID=UPI0007874895|nr:helix-turn-helix transcriptional regulator [Streptomyces sp. NBRC 110468]
MATRPLEIGPAGLYTARAIEHMRLALGLTQHQLAARCTAMGRPMTNTALSRTERAHRRCDIDDLVLIAEALGVMPTALLPAGACPAHPRHSGADIRDRAQGVLLG